MALDNILDQWFSKYDPQASIIISAWELVGNAYSWAQILLNQKPWEQGPEIHVLISPSGESESC